MKLKEIRALSDKEMEEKTLELRKELLKIRGQIAVGTIPKSPGKVKSMKRTLARMIQVKSQKSNQGGNAKNA